MKRAGTVTVRQLGPSRFAMHIAAPWKGTVTVVLPVTARVTGVAHRKRRGWIVEPGIFSKGFVRVRVRSLSVFDTTEQLRYAVETMNLPYKRFLARKADFVRNGCSEPRLARDCRKPSPYNTFNWTDDGCSPSWMPPPLYRNLFNGPCQQHDFGYRNFGNGPRLGRNEDTRAWIDTRFAQEMGRLCTDTFSNPLQTANEVACKSEAGYVVTAVRNFGRSAFYKPPEPGPPIPTPTPVQIPEPVPTLTPIPTATATPSPAPTAAPSPQPQTWSETTGGATNTWTNWTNAGGYQGATIPRYATVQIACKLTGFRVANGNPWWYRIAQAPWNGAYYASADAFYNNGQTSGSLAGTPWVDPAVRDC